MAKKQQANLAGTIQKHQAELLRAWVSELTSVLGDGRISEAEIRQQATDFLQLTLAGLEHGNGSNLDAAEWAPVREFLDGISRSRATQGFSASETAQFIFSFKKPLFMKLQNDHAGDAESIAAQYWVATELLDSLGLYTAKAFQKSREDVILRQQEELLELSTPVVKLWDGVLALPMIGTLDSARTQVVMESLLQRIVDTGSEIAIIDITGVPTVDTLVAQHLLKTVTAIRLMGADCIISGIRPQIAQTIVHLGVDLQGVTTKSTLADALTLALKRLGFVVGRPKAL